MTVTASFTAAVEAGCSPLTVTFADTSDGSPTHWHWDFGDGFTSGDQNPVHIYTVDGTYTVSLKAWASTGTTTRTAAQSAKEQRSGGQVTGLAAAHEAFVSATWGPTGLSANFYRVQQINSTDYSFGASRLTFTFNFGSDGGKVIIIEGKYRTGTATASAFLADSGETIPNPSSNVYNRWIDASGSAGGNLVLTVADLNAYAILGDPGGVGNKKGWEMHPDAFGGARATAYSFSSQDTETKTDFILVGEPTADFSQSLSSGPSPLSVNFTDLSIGSGLTYSWRRRVTGSGAAYAEFSTAQNPTEIFDKLSP